MAGLQFDVVDNRQVLPWEIRPATSIFNPFDYQEKPTIASPGCVNKCLPELTIADHEKQVQDAPNLLTRVQFFEKCKEQFKTLDKNGDGFLKVDELATQVQDGSIKGEQAQFIAALFGSRKLLQKQSIDGSSDDGYPYDPKGVSLADIEQAEKLMKAKSMETSNPYTLEALLKLDTSGDGNLSKEELVQALKGPLPKDEADLLKYYVDNNDPTDPVKVTDVLTYFAKNDLGDKTDKMLNTIDVLLRRTQHAQTVGIKTLFEDKCEDDREGVGIYGIEQGVLGDCYFMSSLAAVAQMSPNAIKDACHQNDDGSFTVTFPGAKSEPITVSALTEAERGIFNGGAEHGEWGAVIEKAYGAYCQKHFWRRTPLNMGGGTLPQEGADGGGIDLANVLHLLTNKETNQDWFACPIPLLHWLPMFDDIDKLTQLKLSATVGSEVENKVPVVAWQKPWKSTASSDVTNHVYSVLDYDRNGDDGGTLTLYNPWGHKEKISFEQFKRRFMSMAYQTER